MNQMESRMPWLYRALVLCGIVVCCVAEFNPTLIVKECDQEMIIVTLSNASAGGIIYVQGRNSACKQFTSAGQDNFQFDYQACSIKFEDQFKLVVQKKSLYQTGDDKVIPVMCMVDTGDIVVRSGINVNDKEADEGQNKTTKTSGFMKLYQGGNDVTGGDVRLSDFITMKIFLHENFQVDFDIKAQECTAATIPVIDEFCASDIDLFPNFQKPHRGLLEANFGAFRPTDLTGGRVAITFSCTLTVCRGDCQAETCSNGDDGWGRKKRDVSRMRRAAAANEEQDITVGTTLRIVSDQVVISEPEEKDEICMNSLGFVAGLVALGAGLIASSASTAIMAKRLLKKQDALKKLGPGGFSNPGAGFMGGPPPPPPPPISGFDFPTADY